MNKALENYLKDEETKFTLIIGSGFHRQVLGKYSILSNWEMLLNQYNPKLNPTYFFPLAYEELVASKTYENSENLAAYEIEEKLSKIIKDDIKKEQLNTVENYHDKYPIDIFNPKLVSDVISLNFDTLAEELLVKEKECNLSEIKKIKFESSKSKPLVIEYRTITFPDGNEINFWHPHGSIDQDDKLTLGIREYGNALKSVERLRNYSKQKETSKPETETSWYHQLTHNPVLILGAGMSTKEWDMWFAITNRQRNFHKEDKKQYNHPIFKMCAPKEVTHHWFTPLFKDMTFDEQWAKLNDYLKKGTG